MVRAVPVLGSSEVIIAVSATTRCAASTGDGSRGLVRASRSASDGSASSAAIRPELDASRARPDGV